MLKEFNLKKFLLLILIVFIYFIIINIFSLVLFRDNEVNAGVLVPPKGFEYKYDPEAPNPVDKTEEGNEKLENKPKKIYYYNPDLFKNYYQNNIPNKINNDNVSDYNNQFVSTNNDYNAVKNTTQKQINNSFTLMNFLLIISSLGVIALILWIFYINNLKQKEAQNTIPVYMKYPDTKSKLKKRRTVFDVKK
jgi:hypothetical protein